MPDYKLHYFALYGRAEPARLMLSHAKADWEDSSFGFEAWPALKATMPGGVVPCLELADGTKMGESFSIFRFLGAKLGYYSADPMLAFRSDEIMDAFKGWNVGHEACSPMFEKDPDARKAAVEAAFSGPVPAFLDTIEETCKKGVFLTGDQLSVADFVVGAFYFAVFANTSFYAAPEAAAVLAKYDGFKAWGDRFLAVNKEYLKDRSNVYPI